MIKGDKNKVRLIGLSFFILLTALLVYKFGSGAADHTPSILTNVIVDPIKTINSLSLIDHKENAVTMERFSNNWTFLFFGFTHCPDVCPATLTQLVQINKAIHEKTKRGDQVQFFFVSVDPDRDTLKHLADYIKYFDSTFTAMTGSEVAIKQLEKQLGAYHKIERKDSATYYTVQHSSEIYLIDPIGRLTARFRPPMDLDLVLRQFNMIADRYANAVI